MGTCWTWLAIAILARDGTANLRRHSKTTPKWRDLTPARRYPLTYRVRICTVLRPGPYIQILFTTSPRYLVPHVDGVLEIPIDLFGVMLDLADECPRNVRKAPKGLWGQVIDPWSPEALELLVGRSSNGRR
jgi:hypothetical protein